MVGFIGLEESNSVFGKSAKLVRAAGYDTTLDINKPEVAITGKDGNIVFNASGKKAQELIDDFANDPAVVKGTVPFEDWVLVNYCEFK